jgi:predicted aspartyl protease
MYESQDYFNLHKSFHSHKKHLPEIEQLYFAALINNAFNKAGISNLHIQKILDNQDAGLTDHQMSLLYRSKLNNHINLYEYALAAQTSEILLEQYNEQLDSLTTENLTNEIKIWRALSDVPQQEISIFTDNDIPMLKDKVGLLNIDVTFKNQTINFIFDTGANFSAVKRSLVQPLGLQYIESDFYVTAATGAQVKTDLAIAPAIIIGDMLIKNVVFLILEDEDVSFPQIDYFVNGAIGFPVIEAMEEIQISEGLLHVPGKPTEYNYNNFALDQLMPIVEVNDGRNDLLFHFDSGATNTSLFPAYYEKYQKQITSNHEIQTLSSTSAGGEVAFQGYNDISVTFQIAESKADLNDIQLHIEDIGGNKSHFHGNLGQDFTSQFEKTIISFKHASIMFE